MTKSHKDRLQGGLADKSDPADFNKKQLAKGIAHELEHTSDRKIAKEIAMDHLYEDPKYYDKLESIEEMRIVIRSVIAETWSQHLDKSMDTGDGFPWDNQEPGVEDDDPNNLANIYQDANNSLDKTSASVHMKSMNQKAGVGRGSGPTGGGRFPGGKRQA